MGVTEYPCPSCGQNQRTRAPNGEEVFPQLCPSCQEDPEKVKAYERARASEEGYKARYGERAQEVRAEEKRRAKDTR